MQRFGAVPELKPRAYPDGSPIHQLQYLQVKLLLRGDHFRSSDDLRRFSRVVAQAADNTEVDFATRKRRRSSLPRIREILFLDTPDFLLYKNAFILRRRILYEDGFLVGDPEIVFKFRHANLQKAAEVDVRPHLAGDFRVKFKVQALALTEHIGGFRLLFSHNVQFPLSAVRHVDRRSMGTVLDVLPALGALRPAKKGKIALVNNAAIDEILVDIGDLDFGKHMGATASVALWRTRGDLQQLVGEFSFQVKFRDRRELPDEGIQRCKKFFLELQQQAADWISFGTTKTGTVYGLKKGQFRSHE
jgi:hypothetical protein